MPVVHPIGAEMGSMVRPVNLPRDLQGCLSFHAPLTTVSTGGTQAPTFTRATAATHVDSTGVIKDASGVIRFETAGYLCEGAVTNQNTRTEDYTDVNWTKTATTITADADAGPDGGTTADRIVEAATTDFHRVFESITATADPWTFSVYLKAGERTWASLRLDNGGANYAWFNLSAGTIGTVGAGLTAAMTAVTGRTGWYRCSVTATATAVTWYQVIGLATGDGASSYAGDATKGIYAWGAQVEKNPVATSYIPSAASATTRNADVLTYPVASVPATGPGTLVCVADSLIITVAGNILDIRNTSNQQGVFVGMNASAFATMDMFTTTSQAPITSAADAFVASTAKRVACAWMTDDCQLYSSDVSRGTDTAATLPTANSRINVGTDGNSLTPWFGHVRRVSVFNARLTNFDLPWISS